MALFLFFAGLTKDYRLEVLRRSGGFEFIFKDNPRFIRYQSPSKRTMLFRIMTRRHMLKGYQQIGFKDHNNFLKRGIPCLNLDNTDYKSHLAEGRKDSPERQTIYISTSTSKGSFFDPNWGHYDPTGPNYIFHVKPRGLNIINAIKTDENAHPNDPRLSFLITMGN